MVNRYATSDRTVLTDLSIWDGIRAVESDTLILRGSSIEAVCERADLSPADARRAVSLAGATAMPGLVDAHVHLVLDPEHTTPPAPGESGDPASMRHRAETMVASGITAARDLGGGAWQELELRDAIDRGEVPGPHLKCAGQPVTSPGGHCHFWGGEAADATAAADVIARQVDRGVDLIKVMATGGRFTKGSSPIAPQFDPDTLRSIVASATAAGLKVAAHCHGTPGIEAAALAGVHSIEHCSWVGPEGWGSDYRADVTELMVLAHTWVSPTINRGWQRFVQGDSATFRRMNAALVAMREAGVRLMASTDAGIPGVFHHHLPEALAVFTRVAGLGNEETLVSATSAAADGIGLGATTGRLVPGFDADVLVIDGDPLEDLATLTRPIGIWARGRPILRP
jgi:imidazolonepropionase-like amidohydrolase